MKLYWPRLVAAFLALLPAQAVAQAPMLRTELVAAGFEKPLLLTAPAADDRLFVIEQPGRIWIVKDGRKLDTPFLDIRSKAGFGGERGLLGLAFHPSYRTNGRFFVNYTDRAGDTRIEAYNVSDNPDRADPNSAAPLLGIDQPAANHNGGWLAFGPDGYLYIGMGDGGGGGDTFRNGQNKSSLLGKILRIDVDGGKPYAIPSTNPFANGGGAREIFAYGLRNPWRADFDGMYLYVADVGQNAREEISIIPIDAAGANLGWPIMEGTSCYNARTCNRTGLVTPVHEYPHASGGCSITGGYVYRGAAIPSLAGHYFFSDYCAGFIRSFRYDGRSISAVTDWSRQLGNLGQVTSFGEDGAGELYVVVEEGRVFRIVAR